MRAHMKIIRQLIKSYCLTAVLLLSSTSSFSQSAGSFVPCQEMPAIMQEYNADFQVLNRFYSPAVQGFSVGGGGRQSAGSSPEKRERLNKLSREYLVRLDQLDFDGLSQECKADYILFKRDLNEKIRLADLDAQEYAAVKQWFPFADDIFALEKSRRRGAQPKADKVAADWSSMAKTVKELQAKVQAENNMPVMSIRKANETIGLLKLSLKSIYDFYNGYDPMFTWWVPKSYTALDEALTAYQTEFTKKQVPDKNGIVARKPVGRDEIVRLLNYEMVNYTPEELVDIANKEFAWCDKEMLKASKEMGFGNDWKAALEKVKNTYVPEGKQPEAILKLYNESVDFVKKHDLVTIPEPAEEVWGMNMMSPERQRTNAFFTGGWDITISYPTNTMEEDDRLMSMRGNNPNFSRATVHHELIPGHNLEFFSNARNRTYRNFDTPFWVEGWSLYWELLLWDMKFPQTPEEKVGMLFWRMHRCARIIFSFNFHMGKWTPQQCIDFLVERVGHERMNATSEIRGPLSGNSNPLYQVAYLTGGFEFYALKKELVDSGKMTYKEFHDAVMHLNTMPVEMIRAILTKQALNKNYKTSWNFFDKLLPF